MSYAWRPAPFRRWYALLLSLFPRDYRERVGAAMLDTFDDLCRQHQLERRGPGFLAGVYMETGFAVIKEHVMNIKETQKIGVVSLILLVPFCLTVALALGWQILYSIGLAGSPANVGEFLGRFLGNSQLYFPVIFLFPLIAFLLSFGGLLVAAYRAGGRATLTLEFARANWLILAVVVAAAVSALFLFGHDAIPCFIQGLLEGGWNNGSLLQVCGQA